MDTQTLKSLEPIHFIGINGAGMNPLAHLSLKSGLSVSGSDLKRSENTKRIVEAGATFFGSHSEANIDSAKTIVYSTAISEKNPEFSASLKHNKNLMHRSDLLACMLNTSPSGIAILGTHGKTTTSSMTAFLLQSLGLKVSAVIGGEMKNFSTSYLYNKESECFIAEADESDGTFTKYNPHILVLTNIDKDHLDFYASLENIENSFLNYISNCVSCKTVIVNSDKISKGFIERIPKSKIVIKIGKNLDSDIILASNSKNECALSYNHKTVTFTPPFIGLHNLENAACAVAVCIAKNLSFEAACKRLSTFEGVKRRMDILYMSKNLLLVDDYAHNPGKIQSCVLAIRNQYKDYKLVTIFQPHRYSRLKTMYKEFISSFKGSDKVFVTPVFSAGEQKDDTIREESLAEHISTHSNCECMYSSSNENLIEKIASEVSETKTIILTVGAGNINDIALQIKERISIDGSTIEKKEGLLN